MEQGEIILYQPDETVKLEVRMENETVWLTQAQIAELKDYVDYIDWKQNFYDEVQSGKRPYISNLIQVDE